MNPISTALLALLIFSLLLLPRKWAMVPFFIGSIYLNDKIGFSLGGVYVSHYRLLLLAGLCRVIIFGETPKKGIVLADFLVAVLGIWCVFASFFHEQGGGSGFVFTAGSVFTLFASYFLVRAWCCDIKSIQSALTIISILLAPVALGMVFERMSGTNLFSIMGGVDAVAGQRNGEFRARGPFQHPILAGTVGASCLPFMIVTWRLNKRCSIIGFISCLGIVYGCNSSGPIASGAGAVFFVCLWPLRKHTKLAVWMGILGYIVLEIFSNRRVYEILFNIDLVGGSTGVYRSRLINTTIEHFNEWWLFGTDRTAHWIPSDIGSIVDNGKHLDITNYYIYFGVYAGFLAVVLLITILCVSFNSVVKLTNPTSSKIHIYGFLIWCVCASMLSHAASSLSVAYFDQSVNFFWFSIALISALAAMSKGARVVQFPRISKHSQPARFPQQSHPSQNSGNPPTTNHPNSDNRFARF